MTKQCDGGVIGGLFGHDFKCYDTERNGINTGGECLSDETVEKLIIKKSVVRCSRCGCKPE